MSQRIVLDPVTRIEGHLRIEADVDGGQIGEAWVSGTMFRGMEIVLRGRDPREAWLFTQRICGVCTTVHAIASVRAVEDALGVMIPPNARLMRNLIMASQLIQDHVVHFYALHALDWVDVSSALQADPSQTAALAQSISDWPSASSAYFAGVQQKVKSFVESGQPGFLASAYWGHPAYRLPPEANLMALAHYLEALDFQREFIKVHALLGGKNPHTQTFLVGGQSYPVDPNSQNALNADGLAFLRSKAQEAIDFVSRVYVPDLLAVASFYKDWAAIGGGVGNFLCYGDYPMDDSGDPASLLLPRGRIVGKDLGVVLPVDQSQIAEYATHSWYQYSGGDETALHPWRGETTPRYVGPKPPYEHLEVEGKYSWLKAPRYEDMPMEVGPLARMLVAYASGVPRVRELVEVVLKHLQVGPEALFSTLGRTAARGIETLFLCEQLNTWIDQLASNMANGDLRIHAGEKWDPQTWPAEAEGCGWHEAPRGALGHWVRIKDGEIANYQAVVPTTWNASPRDAKGQPGPYEAALVGTPIADSTRPIEILRTIHSFDPCIACAVHLLDGRDREISRLLIG
ncbi:MAG: nickel-dependent hydrogenase large subunit [Anaerolineae bacterium]